MLKKLLKHELQATGRYMWIVYLTLVLVSVAGVVCSRFASRNIMAIEEHPVVSLIMILVWVLFIGVLIAASIITIAMNVYRFYKNFLTDEGYLMFTLPVNVHQLVWSKLLVGMLWSVCTTLLVFVGIYLVCYNFVAGITLMEPEIGDIFGEMFGYLDLNFPLLAVLAVLCVIVSSGAGVLEFYCVLSTGFGFTKNKGLWSVVIYFAISTIMGFISGAVNVLGMFISPEQAADTMMNNFTATQFLGLCMLGGMALYALMAVAFYFVTTWNLRKRLNLA